MSGSLFGGLRRGGDAQQHGNFLLCTFDSCRLDSFHAARKPNLEPYGPARAAWAQATYTLPAHLSMFAGFLPHVFAEEPFYNRFIRQMWRIQHRQVNTPPLMQFSPEHHNVVEGFAAAGYQTVGVAAMAWFRAGSPLRKGFRFFERTKTNARRQVDIIGSSVERSPHRPFFGFINFGETHYPYTYEGMPGLKEAAEERADLARLRNPKGVRSGDGRLDEELWRQQVACVEYLDGKMGELFRRFDRLGLDVTVVICGDHGEALGEEGLFGHGFYHPRVMEVPMLVFEYQGSRSGRRGH